MTTNNRRTAKPKAEEKEQPAVEGKQSEQVTNSKRTIVSEGKEFEVNVENINGREILQESIYREQTLPNSTRKTYILVKAKGTAL